MVDLNKLIPSETARIELRHPETGKVIFDDAGPLWIEVMGRDSDTMRQRRFERIDETVEDLGRAGRMAAGRYLTAEEAYDRNITLLADATVGWSENMELDGKPLPFSHENADRLYHRIPWIKEQIDVAIAERAGFFTDSSGKSKRGRSGTQSKPSA